MHKREIIWTLAVIFALAPIAIAQDSEQTTVPFEKIIENPKAFRNLEVSFVVQFHRIGSIDNPFYTKFESAWFENFSAWPDSTQLWEKKQYTEDYPFLFVPRHSQAAKTIAEAGVYQRFAVTGRVEAVFRGKAWIEVTGLKTLGTNMDRPAIISLVRGFRASKRSSFGEAAKHFAAVDRSGLPLSVRLMAIRNESFALFDSGNTESAFARLDRAVEDAPDESNWSKDLTEARLVLKKKTAAAPVLTKAAKKNKPVKSGDSKKAVVAPKTKSPKCCKAKKACTKCKSAGNDVHPLEKKLIKKSKAGKSGSKADAAKKAEREKRISLEMIENK